MSNKTKIKILNMNLLIVLIILILGAVFSINVKATTKVDMTEAITSYHGEEGIIEYWDQSDWDNNWWLVCCYYGVSAPSADHGTTSSGTKINVFDGNEFYPIVNGSEYKNGGSLTLGENAKSISITDNNSSDIFNAPYSFVYAQYTKNNSYVANPSEAYLLSKMDMDGSYPKKAKTKYQLAWWYTRLGSDSGKTVKCYTGAAAIEKANADAFQSYIERIMGFTEDDLNKKQLDTNNNKWAEYTLKYNGKEKVITAPNLADYYTIGVYAYKENGEKIGITEGDNVDEYVLEAIDKYYEETDGGRYVVGPFSVEYYSNDTSYSCNVSDLRENIEDLTNLKDDLKDDKKLDSIEKFETEINKTNPDINKIETLLDNMLKDMMYLYEVYNENDEFNSYLEDFEVYYNFINNIISLKDNINKEISNTKDIIKNHCDDFIKGIEDTIEELNKYIAKANEEGKVIFEDDIEKFCGIEDMSITTNLDDSKVFLSAENGKGNNYIWQVKHEDGTIDKKVPKSGEKFYLVLKYTGNYKEDNGLTSIMNMSFDYKYMNAGGIFDKYTGVTYTQKWIETTIEKGENKYKHTLTAESPQKVTTNTTQAMGVDVIASMWWEEASVIVSFTNEEQHVGYIQIKKTVLDEDGKTLPLHTESGDGEDFIFKFALKESGESDYISKGDITVHVDEGESAGYSEKKEVIWYGDGAPEFKITERKYGDWNYNDSKNSSNLSNSITDYGINSSDCPYWKGTIKENDIKKPITIKAYNTAKVHNGKIYIEKDVQDDKLGILDNESFDFTVKITGTFKYDGKDYNNETWTKEISIKAGETWKSENIYWYGNDKPGCEIIEAEGDLYQCVRNDQSESLNCKDCGENYNTFKFINKPNIKNTKIEIEKKLKSGVELKDSDEFTVEVTVSPYTHTDTEKGETVTEPFYIMNNDGNYIEYNGEFKKEVKLSNSNDWTWESNAIFWVDNAPYVSVKETNSGKYEYYSITDKCVTNTITVNASNDEYTYKNQLDDSYQPFKITITNDDNIEEGTKGKLKIEKNAVNDYAGIVASEKFNFTVKVSGTFKYDDEYYNNETWTKEISITVDKPWVSGTFEWTEKDGAPTYIVTENLTDDQIDEGVKFGRIYSDLGTKVSNDKAWLSGSLVGGKDSATIVTVTCENGSEQNYGHLLVTKKLLDSDGNEITSEDSEIFTIRIQIYTDKSKTEIMDDYTIDLVAGKTYESGYYYWSGNTAPYYEVTEETTGYDVTDKHAKGSLISERNTVASMVPEVIITNTLDIDNTGNILIKKVVEVDDKVSTLDEGVTSVADGIEFEIEVIVYMRDNGVFSYNGNIYDNENPLKLVKKLQDGEEWLIEGISWSGSAPKFAVSEISIPDNFILDYMKDGVNNPTLVNLVTKHNEEFILKDGKTVGETVYNKYDPNTTINLTMEIGGKVWNDTAEPDKISTSENKATAEDGVYNEGEPGIEGVKVTVSRGIINNSNGKLYQKLDGVYAYDSNYNLIREDYGDWYVDSKNGTIYTYTDSEGNWSIPKISVPALVGDEQTKYGDLLSSSGIEDGESKYKYRVAYYVTFTYDGQTYEPTTFLALEGNTTIGTTNYNDVSSLANNYTSSSLLAKDDFLLSSFAVDDKSNRENFNEKFETIKGYTTNEDKRPISEDGYTWGKAATEETKKSVELKYSSTETVSIGNNGNKKLVSKLLTDSSSYGETGTDSIYSKFQIDASTINANLAFPADNNINLDYFTIKKQWVSEDGSVNRTYHGIYNYMNNINLGLVEREAADIAVKNDLEEMIITINGTEVTYKFNSLYNYNEEENLDYLLTQLEMEDLNITYTLGLYAGDYYYRAASIYGESEDDESKAGKALDSYIKSIDANKGLSALDLNVYLRYKTTIINESLTYDVNIRTLYNYHDETLEIVDPEDEYVYIKTDANGTEVNGFKKLSDVAGDDKIEYNKAEGNITKITWSDNERVTGIQGSDGVRYTKEKTNSTQRKDGYQDGAIIYSGGTLTYETTYKINTENMADGVALQDAIILGEKHNIVEIGSFSDYYSDESKLTWGRKSGEIAGRVDEDSAPNNINVAKFNDTAYYEDDTMQAPMAYVTLSGKDREINGIVWEDARTEELAYSQIVGNGYYNLDEGDKLIEGLTTELVEVISVPTDDVDDSGNIIYEEYDFIWPTDKPLECYDNNTIKGLTGFDSSTTTDEMGSYKFVGVPTGNYKVRFVYGDKAVETGNDGYEVVYNGQDYKSTTYQAGFNNDDNNDDNDNNDDGYIDNAWHNLSSSELEAARVSDARDSEARRLYIESKSEIQTYSNTSVLALADDTSADYDELFGNYNEAKEDDPVIGDGYYMYAETAKIKMDVENDNELTSRYISTNNSGYKTYTATEVKGHTTVENYKYEVDNIDFGLEERPQTKLLLDKQIKEITLTTSDEEVILDAVYNINYKIDEETDEDSGGYQVNEDLPITVTVSLDEENSTGYSNIASLNRSGNNQGYRYLMIDSNILQGATITVDYQLSVFNVGETDTISSRLTEFWERYNASGKSQEDRNNILENVLTELTSPYNTLTNRLTRNKDYNYQYGTYVGSIYYLGKDGKYYYNDNDNENENDNAETVYGESYHTDLVKTTVHNIIDYVDPDVEFISTDNLSKDQSWSTTTIEYLLDNKLIDPNNVILIKGGDPVPIYSEGHVIGVETYESEKSANGDLYRLGSDESWAIINDNLQEYIVYDDSEGDESESNELKNNIALSIDNNDVDSDTATNPGLVKGTVPYVAYCNYAAENAYENGEKLAEEVYNATTAEQFAYDRATAVIDLQVSRYYSSETDIEEIDNIAEILKVENTAGRRSTKTIAGNTMTYQLKKNEDYEEVNDLLTETISIYAIALQDADTSATEIITLSPPTGLSSNTMLGIQIAAITLITLSILGIGITFIRKKVLK